MSLGVNRDVRGASVAILHDVPVLELGSCQPRSLGSLYSSRRWGKRTCPVLVAEALMNFLGFFDRAGRQVGLPMGVTDAPVAVLGGAFDTCRGVSEMLVRSAKLNCWA